MQGLEIPPELGKAFKETRDLCLEKTGAREENLRNCKDNHIPGEESSKCYLDCMIEHIKVRLDDAAIHVQNMPHELTDQWHEMMSTARGVCGEEGKSTLQVKIPARILSSLLIG